MSVIPELGRQSQEDYEFEGILGDPPPYLKRELEQAQMYFDRISWLEFLRHNLVYIIIRQLGAFLMGIDTIAYIEQDT